MRVALFFMLTLRAMQGLEGGKAARAIELSEDAREAVRGLQLLTMKPLTYAANVSEDDLADASGNVHVQARLAAPLPSAPRRSLLRVRMICVAAGL